MIWLALLTPASAAEPCDALTSKVATTDKAALAPLMTKLIQCDKQEASKRFMDFVRAGKDVETVVAISLAAIEGELYQPVWGVAEALPDASSRAAVAKGVASACTTQKSVLPFLQGGYFGANDTSFRVWGEALATCSDPALLTWIGERVSEPPARPYDAKYNKLVEALVGSRGPDALPALEKGAVAAAKNGGPFPTVLEAMQSAVSPREMGSSMTPEMATTLADAYVRVGNGDIPSDKAGLVADRLYQNGAADKAAGLLTVVHGDKLQSDGTLMYGVAAVESCDGEAVVHLAEVREPGKRWSIQKDVEAPARAFKPRLKCTPDGQWEVVTTPTPMTDEAALEVWGKSIADQWTAKKLAVEVRDEKAVELP